MNTEELRQKIQHTPTSPALPFWNQQVLRLRHDILNQNPVNFISFPTIRETMYVGDSEYTYDEYRELQNNEYQQWLKDDTVFVQRKGHPLDGTTTGNTIHHTYHLYQFEKYAKTKLSTINSVLEFGGGYGNMARIVKSVNVDIDYTIIDLPELLLLQEYYLTSLDINDVSFATQTQPVHIDLFIATWSLSEAPLTIRTPYLNLDCDNFLLAFSYDFKNINNLNWFKQFAVAYPKLNWIIYENPLIPKSYYMIGSHNVSLFHTV